jgi:MFS family permease
VGRDFEWLWGAYAVSTAGTWLAFDAFPLIAILVLHSSPTQVSLLAAAGLAVGALVAVPLGPWVEVRRKQPVMVGMDVVRFAVIMSVPVTYALGQLTYGQLIVVSVVVAAANIGFSAASGASIKALVPKEKLLHATGRFEATMWTATALGPPLGGAAIGILGPFTTTVANAVSYLLSALGIGAMRWREPRPAERPKVKVGLDGWRFILGHPRLRPLFFNTILANGLIMTGAPLAAVLLLGDLGFTPLEYGLAFGVPCVGGLIGSRWARRLVRIHGSDRVLRVSGVVRVLWPIGLAFVPHGPWGLVVVILVEFGVITSCGVFNPVYASYRLENTPGDLVARVLSAWSITSSTCIAFLTMCGGVLAGFVGTRGALVVAGVLLLCTPVLLPRNQRTREAVGVELGAD